MNKSKQRDFNWSKTQNPNVKTGLHKSMLIYKSYWKKITLVVQKL